MKKKKFISALDIEEKFVKRGYLAQKMSESGCEDKKSDYLLYAQNDDAFSYFGRVTLEGDNILTHTDTGFKSSDIDEVIEKIKEYNATLDIPIYLYDPTINEEARVMLGFKWYVKDVLGFSNAVICDRSVIVKDGNADDGDISKTEIRLYLNKIYDEEQPYGSGTITIFGKGDNWIDCPFTDLQSMFSAVNTIVEGLSLKNALFPIITLSKLRKGRSYDKLTETNLDVDALDGATIKIKNKLREFYKKALEELDNETN